MSILINNCFDHKKVKKAAIRKAFGEAIVVLGEKYKDIVALSADLISSTKLDFFKNKFSDRFFQVGVAEQNMIGVAAGLAIAGKTPFVASFATFCPGRCLDQIRVQVCLNNLNVKIIGSHAGLSHPKDGATAQATEDIAIMRSLPKMTVLVPADYNQMISMLNVAYKHVGPVYIRVAREKTAVFIKKETVFKIGQVQTLMEGKDITIISAGPLLYQALLAAKRAKDLGISCQVLNLATIKPIDKMGLINSIKKTKAVLTIEDHQIQGGIGSAVAEVVSEKYPLIIKMMGLNDQFGRSAQTYQALIKEYGLDNISILNAIKILKKRIS